MEEEQPQKSQYMMTTSRTTIDKLGVKLYDKASAVVSELIANSYFPLTHIFPRSFMRAHAPMKW